LMPSVSFEQVCESIDELKSDGRYVMTP
jgi:hypothetical protein